MQTPLLCFREGFMKQKLTPREFVIKLTGILFAVYSAYNVFIIIRDNSGLTPQAILISAVVALMFGVLAAYALTFGLIVEPLFLQIRRTIFIAALLIVFALKLRMVGAVAAYFDPSKIHTVLYCVAYGMTQTALLVLLVYYIFIRGVLLFFPKARVILPTFAAALFLCSLILEAILCFAYDIRLEASFMRTIVIRPVFYLAFIGLSVYFLFLPKPDTALPDSSAADK